MMTSTPTPLKVSSTTGATNVAAMACAFWTSPMTRAVFVIRAVLMIMEDTVATPPPQRKAMIFIFTGSGSHRSMKTMADMTMSSGTTATRVITAVVRPSASMA